jgi:broad specificity phosphatase PhoE
MPERLTRRASARRSRAALPMVLAVLFGTACAGVAVPHAAAPMTPAAVATPAAPGPLTVIVTRHAERADDGSTRDPELSPAGRARARALADAVGRAGIESVITTQYVRTRDTAAPLAALLGLTQRVVESASGGADAHVAELRSVVLAHPPGSVVLVVGHSNTVPMLVRALTGHPIADMPESEYGTLFIVTLPGGGAAPRVVRATYPVPAT